MTGFTRFAKLPGWEVVGERDNGISSSPIYERTTNGGKYHATPRQNEYSRFIGFDVWFEPRDASRTFVGFALHMREASEMVKLHETRDEL